MEDPLANYQQNSSESQSSSSFNFQLSEEKKEKILNFCLALALVLVVIALSYFLLMRFGKKPIQKKVKLNVDQVNPSFYFYDDMDNFDLDLEPIEKINFQANQFKDYSLDVEEERLFQALNEKLGFIIQKGQKMTKGITSQLSLLTPNKGEQEKIQAERNPTDWRELVSLKEAELSEKVKRLQDIEMHLKKIEFESSEDPEQSKFAFSAYKTKLRLQIEDLKTDEQRIQQRLANLKHQGDIIIEEKSDYEKKSLYTLSFNLMNEKEMFDREMEDLKKEFEKLSKEIPNLKTNLEKMELELEDLKLEHQILLLMDHIEDKGIVAYQTNLKAKISALNNLIKNTGDFRDYEDELKTLDSGNKELPELKKISKEFIEDKNELIEQKKCNYFA